MHNNWHAISNFLLFNKKLYNIALVTATILWLSKTSLWMRCLAFATWILIKIVCWRWAIHLCISLNLLLFDLSEILILINPQEAVKQLHVAYSSLATQCSEANIFINKQIYYLHIYLNRLAASIRMHMAWHVASCACLHMRQAVCQRQTTTC